MKTFSVYTDYSLGGNFYANMCDYQGNLVASSGEYFCGVAQGNSYYPYGLPVRGGGITKFTSYLYGGKEFENRQGLNIYDFKARTYAPDECRFWQPDPMADDYHWLSPYSYCGGDPINFVDPDGCDFWYTNDISEITNFYNTILRGEQIYDFSNWLHITDMDFLKNLVYDDDKCILYATYCTVANGEFTVNCTKYNFHIYPVINYYNRQVYEPVNGILDEISYSLDPWTYNDGRTTWSVGRDGRIKGPAPIIGYPPLVGKGKGIFWKSGRFVERIGKIKGNAPRPNSVQNTQVKQLAKKYKLDDEQINTLHDYIGGQGYSYHEIEQAIRDLFY